MRKIYPLWSLLTLIFFQAGCKKFDKPEKAAAYIYIPNIHLQVGPTQGTAANGIIDAWVYVNDQPVGVYELPCLVPMLTEGKQKITIYAGIKDNGIGEERNKYTFYQPYITYDVDLVPGQIDTMKGTVAPVVTYYPASDIDIWYENFDDASIGFVAETNSDAGVTYIGDSTTAFEGNGMGKIELTSSMDFARVHTSQTFTLPKNGKPVYVEINYNTNNSMAIGVQTIIGTDVTNYDNTVIVPTSGVWKKMYVNLTDVVSEQGSATQFKFIITMSKDDGITTAENYIDNFKVVYAK